MNLAIELKKKKLLNMKVVVIPAGVSAIKTDTKGLEKDLRNWKSEDEPRPYRPQ